MQDEIRNFSHSREGASSRCRAVGNNLSNGLENGSDAESSEKDSSAEDRLIDDNKLNLPSDRKESQVEDSHGMKTEDDGYSALLQDRGWAWFVVLGCFISHLIIGGFDRTDGILFLEFTERFQESAQLTAWPPALCSSIRFLSGPLATAVSNRFSVRASVMAGSFIFALGVALSGLAPNVPCLFFTYGILQGFGRGLVYAPGVVIVGMYFSRRRGLGVGLGTAGVGAGTFLLPPVAEMLFQELGFRGAFLILAGIALHLCVVAALFRPLSIHKSIIIGERKKKVAGDKESLENGEASVSSKECSSYEKPNSIRNDPSSAFIERDSSESEQSFQEASASHENHCQKRSAMHKFPILSCCMCILGSCFPVEEKRRDKKKQKLIEWSLLKNPPFLLYCFSICFFAAAFKSAFTFLPTLATSAGISKLDAAYLLSISGIVDTIGRVLAGFILDMPRIRPFRPLAYNGVVFVIVILSFLSPFVTTFAEFAVLFGLYGIMTGTYVSQKSVVVVDILGREKLCSSFGLLVWFQGVGTAIGPPLFGYVRDVYGSYREAFFMGGAAMAAAGGLMVISNVHRIVMARHSKENSTTTAGNVCL